MKRLFLIFAAVLAVTCLASCSFADIFPNNGAAPSAEPSVQTGGGEIAEDPVSYEITAGIIGLDTYNPLTTASDTVKNVCGFVFEPLFEVDSSMCTMHVLAQSYEVSPDGRTLTIQLKPGVTWHDGTPFTASDVVYTANLIKNGGTRYDGMLKDVVSVRAWGTEVVIVSLSRSVPDPALLFTFPIIKNGSANYARFNAVGTGPFFFDQSGNLTANESYYDGRAILNRIVLNILPDSEKYIGLFDASAIDFATSETIDMSGYMPKSNANVWDFISNELIFAGFNTRDAVLSDPYARRAISYLIDRDDAVSRVYFTRAAAAAYALNPSSWAAFDTAKKHNSDISAAKEQLAAGGWELNSNGVYTTINNGKLVSFTVKILVNRDSAERVRIAQALCNNMKAMGIAASVEKCAEAEFSARITAGNYDLFIGETELLPNGDISLLAASGENSFGYSSNEVDVLIAQLGTLRLESDIKEVTRQLHEKLYTDAPYAPICFLKKSLVTGAKLEYGITPSVSGYVRATKYWCNR